jgi:AraC-like DNA-binding protein
MTKTADVLSDVLRAVQLTGAVYFDFVLTAPWVAEAPPSHEIAPMVMPSAQRVIEYHLIAEGGAWGHAIGDAPIPLRPGDLLIFPQGDPHVLSSAPGMRTRPDYRAYQRPETPLPIATQIGGGGTERARIVCGFLGLDERPYNPLLSALPRVIHLAGDGHPSGGWLRTMLEVAVAEAGKRSAGAENVLARLSELMFVEAIRRYIDAMPPNQTGWLAGLRDPIVGRALGAMHGSPAETWTVERLGREVGASRSVIAERFTALVGQPPMQYLALWRMQLASRQLASGQRVSEVAGLVGYDSEAAFSRAFKKLMGCAPAAWRARNSGAPSTTPRKSPGS